MRLLAALMIFSTVFLPSGKGRWFKFMNSKGYQSGYSWSVSSHEISPQSALTLKYDPIDSAMIIGCYAGGGLYTYNVDYQVEKQLIKGFKGGVSAIELIDLGVQRGVVVADEFKGTLQIYRIEDDAKLLATFKGLENITDLVTGDFDQDGLVDIGFSVAQGPLSFWLKNIDNKRFEKVEFKEKFHYLISGLEASDLDQDGDTDLIIYSEELGTLKVLTNEEGGFSTTFISNEHKGVMDIKVVDIDLDKDLDMIMVSHLKKEVIIFRNEDKDYHKDGISIPIKEPTSILIKDFNGDALPDLLITGFSDASLYLMENGLSKFYGASIDAGIAGATDMVAVAGKKDNETNIVISSFDKRLIYELVLSIID